MVAPIRFLSGRQQQQKIGVEGSTESVKVLEVVGRTGIGTTIFTPGHELEIRGTTRSTIYLGEGGALTLGTPSDGDIVTPGALNTFTSNSSVVNSIDDLNELGFNIIKNTAVTGVSLTTSQRTDGDPLVTDIQIDSIGNANQYVIDWGDGNVQTSNGPEDNHTVAHTFNTAGEGGIFTPTVTALNINGVGAGSSFTVTSDWSYVVYTPNPVPAFELYRASTGGSPLSGNDLYVIEGDSLYLDNNTTHCNRVGMNAEFTINWGDGTSEATGILSTAPGGSGDNAARLQHTWTTSPVTHTSTGRDTVLLKVTKNDLSDPLVIAGEPSITKQLKVYDNNPANPDGLSSKTISSPSSTGSSPRLASGFTDNVSGGTTLSAGDSVVRIDSGSGTITAGPISTFAFDGDNGTLAALVNEADDGNVTLSSANNSGTYTSLVVDSESDYNLLNAGGSSVSFANSIYYPGFAKGFKARVAKNTNNISTGANSMKLSHSVTGDTNRVDFVKDDLTAVPVVDVSGATLTEASGSKKYISGIPYYISGTLTLSGVTITNLVGQCYTNQSNIVEVDNGTNQEGTSPSAITNTDYTYAQIDGASSMLTGGIPNVNTGTSSAYAIGDLSVDITGSFVRTVDKIRVRARNVEGIGSYNTSIPTIIRVHRTTQTGINEIAIDVSTSLGETFNDDGVRIFDLSGETTDTPSFNSATNFYTSNPYTESSDPGVQGTQEATVRIQGASSNGLIEHNTNDYSSGYLPTGGPDRSGDTGTQYFTFAFRRAVVANFNIHITSTGGIAGCWIAAPGTQIDNTSGLNKWLNTSVTYAGSGIPGSNTGAGGNGSDGCASNNGSRILTDTPLSGPYTMTLGEENMTNATGNVVLVRIALNSGQSITSLSIS
tara:strand:+ start:39 stop:2690 length:2652 start_codon:yes stop_codon:yes gene_type:complete